MAVEPVEYNFKRILKTKPEPILSVADQQTTQDQNVPSKDKLTDAEKERILAAVENEPEVHFHIIASIFIGLLRSFLLA